MIERHLHEKLLPVARRLRGFRVRQGLVFCWLSAAAVAGTLLLVATLAGWSHPLSAPLIGGAAALTASAVLWRSRRVTRDVPNVARRIEQRYPDLEARLLAALEQERPAPHAPFGFLQEQVIHEALAHARAHRWTDTVSVGRMVRVQLAHVVVVGLLSFLMTGLVIVTPRHMGAAPAPAPPPAVTPAPGEAYEVAVEPGDASVERGTGLIVTGRFAGALPADVSLVVLPASASEAEPQVLAMGRNLDDLVFGVRVPVINHDITYRLEFAEQRTRDFHVIVFEYPRLERADAKLAFPAYTGLPERTVEDTRHVSAVEGTTLTLTCTLNKPVRSAVLEGEDDTPSVALTANAARPTVYAMTMKLRTSARYTLKLVDDEGRGNHHPPHFVIDVLKNQPPKLTLGFPKRDLRVSPLEEVALEAAATDDFGLRKVGISYALAGDEPTEIVFADGPAAAGQKVEVAHLISFEDLDAEADQLLSYYFWADDVGPDGEVRRTLSDMFFAEVRPFDEIFREGQQPPRGAQPQRQQGRSPGARRAGELARLQKDIINATWKVIRRETSAKPTDAFAEDVALVRDSQQQAIEQLDQAKSRFRADASAADVAKVARHMTEAVKHLSAAHDDADPAALRPALAAEQAAYQALLRLRAREHRVSQRQPGQQGGGGGGGGGNRSQEQLNQLELSNRENRYEVNRQAQAQRTPAQREQSQVLNRLRELARRQQDVNQRLKELQAELQQARTEKEREEIERRLKRLREEQQRMLRDVDEMRNRMNQPQNQERMRDARQQADRTRENMRQASEALRQGQVSRALSAGTRAERQLDELRDDFRRKLAGEYGEEMRDMRSDARQLARDEEAIAKELEAMNQAKQRSLRDRGERKAVADKLTDQKKKLEELLDRMRKTVERAEQSEPLLSKQLYDTVRNADQNQVGKNLDQSSTLVRLGFLSDAEQSEQQARKGIEAVKRGVERAAESVLGDEAEALRRARDVLEQLAQQVRDEAARASPTTQPTERRLAGGGPATTRPAGATTRPGGRRLAGGNPTSRPAGATSQPAGPSGRRVADARPGARREGRPGLRPGREGPQGQRGQRAQPGQQQGQRGQPGQRGQQPGQRGQQGQPGQRGQQRGGRRNAAGGPGGGNPRFFDREGLFSGPGGPLRGEDFRDWSDRMRDIEEMLDDPDLRAEAARIRDLARSVRRDYKRHSKEPNWDLVRSRIVEPMFELRDRVSEELARRESKDALVPIDRDPVPPRFAEQVRRYYERLGSGE